MTGSAGQKRIPLTFLKDVKIPLPPLEEQRRIAAVLDKADRLRQLDRQLVAKYDQLTQSVFLDMFGDPVKNEKDFPKGTIRELVSEVKYGTSKPAETNGSFPYLRMNNITYEGHWNLSDLKYINITYEEEEKYLGQKGDLIFNRTNSKELVGKTAVYKFDYPMALAGYLIRVRTNEKALPEYISAYLNSKHGKLTLQNMCKNIVGMANINAQELQNIEILIPPIELQNRFAEIVQNIERQKANIPGPGRSRALGFAANGKGYVGGGSFGNFACNDFYEYDPATNTWTAKRSLFGGARAAGISLSINNKLYIGTGYGNAGTYLNDFWEFMP